MVTCQGRDHIVNVRSGCRSLVVVNVHFEPELTLRSLRGRLRLITPHWPHFPDAIGVILGDFNICDPEEGRFNVWNQPFTEGDTGKADIFHSFFPRVFEIAQPDFTRRDSTVDGVFRTLSRILLERLSIFLWLKHATSTATLMSLRTWENGPYRVTMQPYVGLFKTDYSGAPGQTHSELDVQTPRFLLNSETHQ